MCLKWCTARSTSVRCSNWIPAPFLAFSIEASFLSLFSFQYKGTHSLSLALQGEIGELPAQLSLPGEEWHQSPTSPCELVYHTLPSARRARAESCVEEAQKDRGERLVPKTSLLKLFLLFTLGTLLRNVAYPSCRVCPFLKCVTVGLLWHKIHKPHLFASISHPQKNVTGASLVVQWFRIQLARPGTWVWFLVRELRSHMLPEQLLSSPCRKEDLT